ncbi:hypothetical protein E2C01_002202 [Portunus trituberculatus]|uniref:Uncharacterized protein n=1 Tax=Portunus trituberculatus TaxID=210409 RepID=A0A5B7CJ41_PORTR|nr:hypothetical protein [Portunus trituberculatus]
MEPLWPFPATHMNFSSCPSHPTQAHNSVRRLLSDAGTFQHTHNDHNGLLSPPCVLTPSSQCRHDGRGGWMWVVLVLLPLHPARSPGQYRCFDLTVTPGDVTATTLNTPQNSHHSEHSSSVVVVFVWSGHSAWSVCCWRPLQQQQQLEVVVVSTTPHANAPRGCRHLCRPAMAGGVVASSREQRPGQELGV